MRQDEYADLCAPIISAGAEFIFLIGKMMAREFVETVFHEGCGDEYISHYFLLVLVQGCDERQRNGLQDRIEQGSGFPAVTALVLDLVSFNKWLEEGHPFAVTVSKKALLLYGSNKHSLADAGSIDEEKQKKEREVLCRCARISTEGFLAGAELFMLRNQYRLATFMLHQSAEQSLRALLILHTGLHVVTHNIDKLLRYCLLFCPGLSSVFCHRSEEDRQLLHLLQKAYIEARYRTDYSISFAQAKKLLAKTRLIGLLFEAGIKAVV